MRGADELASQALSETATELYAIEKPLEAAFCMYWQFRLMGMNW
jgi:hypothetical protein